MKNIFFEYSKILGYTTIGLILGLSFFLLFLNFYHYKEVNTSYVKNVDDLGVSQELQSELTTIKNNYSKFNINNYNGNEDIYSMTAIQSKLDLCVKNIDKSKIFNLLNKKEVFINDIYIMQQEYQNTIVNDCLIKQLYDLTIIDDNKSVNISNLSLIAPFLKDNIDVLKNINDYLQSNIKNNSSYSFNSDNSKLNVFNVTKDSYYQIVSSYRKSINLIKDVSIWYSNIIGG